MIERRDFFRLFRLFLGATAVASLGGLSACSSESSNEIAAPARLAFEGVDMSGSELGRNLSLPDFEGKTRTLEDFAGKIAVVFFGYVQCPDVCPTSLQEIAEAKEMLSEELGEEQGQRLQGVFISVDPERDTPEVLREYARAFDPSMIALTGTPDEIAQAARNFKVFYKKVPGSTPESYTMDHSAGMYMYDPQGRLRSYLRYGQGARAIAHDAGLLLKEAQ